MASTLPSLGQPISFANINTELGLATNRQISFNDVMVRGLHGSDSSTQLSMDEFTNIYGIGNPYLANAQTRLVIVNSSGTTLPSLTRSVVRVAVNALPTQNATSTNQEAQLCYNILASRPLDESVGPPAVANGYISMLMNTNHSVTTGSTPSLRFVQTAFATSVSGAGATESITSADPLDFQRIPTGISSATLLTSRGKASQIQTALIIQYNRYLRGTQANSDHVTAGFIRPV
jgi:hypothetical protein